MLRRYVAVAVVACLALLLLASPAAAQVQPYGTSDYGGFRNILPPGENGFDDATQLAAYEANHSNRPPHSSDQLGMYFGLTTAAPNIQAAQIPDYFKDATFGVPAGEVQSTESPEPGVTIVRDKAFGVPHIYGDTRAALEFGIGWATAEDRLFMIDVLRHAGNGTLASFAGGSNAAMDETVWTGAPYNAQDYQNQIAWASQASPYGPQVLQDAENYVAGINAYIAKAKTDPLLMPGEYPALGYPEGPQPFTLPDFISIATLIGAELGNGGGEQLANAVLYESLQQRFGREHYRVPGVPQAVRGHKRPRRFGDRSGYATFASFDSPNDPEAPSTVRSKRFPYQALPMPSKATLKTIALPDPGSVKYVNPVVAGAVPGAAPVAGDRGGGGGAAAGATGAAADAGGAGEAERQIQAVRGGLLAFPRSMSNALLVSARDSASGHPLMVAGPQVSYFSPEILMEEDIHGPGIDARGATFPGTNLYVELGHGQDYAWSATSSSQNIIDTFAVPLCNPARGPVALGSGYYLIGRRCVQMETLSHSESWQPNLADSTPAGSVTFQAQRTAYGVVIARARVHGRPVAYTNLRSTYMHEIDSALGFYLLNDPNSLHNVQDFYRAAYDIQFTFNWFYADDKHIAYFDSGLNPVRARHTDPMFPTWSRYAWAGLHPADQLTPASLTERQTAQSAHPHVEDQSFITSWNNKQAPGYGNPGTSQEYSSVYRSQLLDNNIEYYLRIRHGKLTLADLINAMGIAGTQDLRGIEVLPYALRIIGHPRGALGQAVALLRNWVATGAHRINREHPAASGSYDQSDAVRLVDAWWPLWVKAEFQPVLGPGLLAQVERQYPIHDAPGHGTTCCHVGSAFDVGFYGIVQKDLRAALRLRVRGPLNRIYCGEGSLRRCRAALEASLRQAISESPAQVYPADSDCAAGDQMCFDSIQFRAVGVIGQPGQEWVNRPTFQQANEILGHRPG